MGDVDGGTGVDGGGSSAGGEEDEAAAAEEGETGDGAPGSGDGGGRLGGPDGGVGGCGLGTGEESFVGGVGRIHPLLCRRARGRLNAGPGCNACLPHHQNADRDVWSRGDGA